MASDSDRAAGPQSTPPIAVDDAAPAPLHFTLSRFDRFRGLLWLTLNIRAARWMLVLVALVRPAQVALQYPWLPIEMKLRIAASNVLFIAVLVAVLVPIVSFVMAYATYDPEVLGPHIVSLDDGGVRDQNDVADVTYRWTRLYGVTRAFGFVLVRVTEGRTILVPESTFATPGDADAFERMVRDRIEAAARR